MPRQTELPYYVLLELKYELLDVEVVRVATVLCDRQGCERVFKVNFELWREPWRDELAHKPTYPVSRSCPYCFAAGYVPRESSLEV